MEYVEKVEGSIGGLVRYGGKQVYITPEERRQYDVKRCK